jgi:hypothetical protein
MIPEGKAGPKSNSFSPPAAGRKHVLSASQTPKPLTSRLVSASSVSDLIDALELTNRSIAETALAVR